MRKLLALLVFALFTAGWVSAIESPLYAKTVPVVKVTSHEKGYRVSYLTAHGELKTIYLPIEWLYQVGDYRNADGFVKVEVVRGFGEAYPYMQIFWKDGKFHHLRLFVVNSYNDRTWGVVKDGENLAPKFDPSKPIDFQF